jgi:PAP2 superfamily C-terminal
LWEFPGFYSITVPYGKTNDFFFSGHVGCCIINFLEFKANGWNRFASFSALTCIFQTALMVSLRGHYFIDLISGVIFAHYMWMMAERYSYLVDVKIFKIPFKKRFPMYTHSCTNCQHPVTLWVDQNETQDCIPCGGLSGYNDSIKFQGDDGMRGVAAVKFTDVDKEQYPNKGAIQRTSSLSA